MTGPSKLRLLRRLAVPALALLLLSGCKREEKKQAEVPQFPSPSGQTQVSRTLLYPAEEDMLLTECNALLPSYGDSHKDLAELVKRYVAGPAGEGQVLPYPENCGLRAVFFLNSSSVVVDLSGPVRSGGGSSTETARVYGLVDTIAWNFREIRTVKILVEGQEVDTLLGHLDLSHPLPPEASYLAPPLRRQVGA